MSHDDHILHGRHVDVCLVFHSQKADSSNLLHQKASEMLCESCQDIFRGQRLLVTSEYGDLRSKEFRYRGSKSSIRVAASNGCELCEILCSSFDAEEDAQPAEYPHLEFWIEAPAQLKAGSYFYRLTFMWRTPHRNLRNEIDYKFLDLGIWKSVGMHPQLELLPDHF